MTLGICDGITCAAMETLFFYLNLNVKYTEWDVYHFVLAPLCIAFHEARRPGLHLFSPARRPSAT